MLLPARYYYQADLDVVANTYQDYLIAFRGPMVDETCVVVLQTICCAQVTRGLALYCCNVDLMGLKQRDDNAWTQDVFPMGMGTQVNLNNH